MLPSFLRTRRGRVVTSLIVVLLVAGGAVAYALSRPPGNVSHPNVEFTAPPTTTQAPPPKPKRVDRFRWPWYGFDLARTKALPNSNAVHPPYRVKRLFRSRTLLEFTPAMDRGVLFTIKNDGKLFAMDARTGRIRWKRHLGRLAAATPAVGGGRVFGVFLLRPHSTAGLVAAVRERTGRVLWRRPLPSRAESQPILVGGKVIFGSEDGTVYALSQRSGRIVWRYHASGAVKSGPAYANGKLYFGDYSGEVYAIRASNGAQVWRTSTSGGAFGRSGTFYSTPAVAFGRVYIGNTDGRMYSFAASSGRLAWATRTSNYVYSSPAVANVPGLGPTVYAGSYDGNFYAFNARTGGVRWVHNAGGKISGGAVIIGRYVYYAQLAARRIDALGLKTGRLRWSFHDGGFNPAISDRRHLFVVGFGSIYRMTPKR